MQVPLLLAHILGKLTAKPGTHGRNNMKIISVHTLPKDTPILSKRPSFNSLDTLLKRCVSCMLSNDCKLSYWPMRATETDSYTKD